MTFYQNAVNKMFTFLYLQFQVQYSKFINMYKVNNWRWWSLHR